MNVTEAHKYTLEIIEELGQSIEVRRKPSNSRTSAHCIAKYSGPDRLPPNLWEHVTFIINNPATERASIAKAKQKLTWLGIRFDTGGCMGQHDWEIDWSFTIGPAPDSVGEEACMVLDDLLGAMDTPDGLGLPQ